MPIKMKYARLERKSHLKIDKKLILASMIKGQQDFRSAPGVDNWKIYLIETTAQGKVLKKKHYEKKAFS